MQIKGHSQVEQREYRDRVDKVEADLEKGVK